MKKKIVTEYVEFRTVPGTEEESFIRTVDQLEKQFHSKKEGFIDTELCANLGGRSCLFIY